MRSGKINFPNYFTLTCTPDVICPHYFFICVFGCRFLFAVCSLCSYAVSVIGITVFVPSIIIIIIIIIII